MNVHLHARWAWDEIRDHPQRVMSIVTVSVLAGVFSFLWNYDPVLNLDFPSPSPSISIVHQPAKPMVIDTPIAKSTHQESHSVRNGIRTPIRHDNKVAPNVVAPSSTKPSEVPSIPKSSTSAKPSQTAIVPTPHRTCDPVIDPTCHTN